MNKLDDKIVAIKRESEIKFVRSSGPGGQNVNKTNSAAQLRWSLANTLALSERERNLCFLKLGSQLTTEGELILKSTESRDQAQNIKLVYDKLEQIIRKALFVQRKRIKTKPTYSSKLKRLDTKKIHSEKKKNRKVID